MRERQAVKLSGVSAETEQRGTVETITVAEQSDRGDVHAQTKMTAEGGITPLCMGPKHTTHEYSLSHTHIHIHTLN